MSASLPTGQSAVREGYVPVADAELYYRDVGQGRPIIVIHGGPDFDHTYLLPDMDRLADSYRLLYYDQKGRGKSGRNVQPDQVSIESELEDLESLRSFLDLQSVALLGHSWGGILAMEYALREAHRVTQLILINAAPASHDDLMLFRQERGKTAADDLGKMRTLSSTAEYEAGDLEADAAYYRIHFRAAIKSPEQLERVIQNLRLSQTPEGIRKARTIEQRLYDQTWLASDYSLFPRLNRLTIPTLVIHGEYDFIPVACAAHIAAAVPGARLVVLGDCGHFSFIEAPESVHQALDDFFAAT